MAGKEREEIKSSMKKHDTDTGSSAVQVVDLSTKISDLTVHMQENKKDYACRRSLLKKVAERKKFLTYLQRTDFETYKTVITALGLKK